MLAVHRNHSAIPTAKSDMTQVSLLLQTIFEKQPLQLKEITSVDPSADYDVSFCGRIYEAIEKNSHEIIQEQKIGALRAITEVNHWIMEKLTNQMGIKCTIALDWCLFEDADVTKSHPVSLISKNEQHMLCLNLASFDPNNAEHIDRLQRVTGRITQQNINELITTKHFTPEQCDILRAVCSPSKPVPSNDSCLYHHHHFNLSSNESSGTSSVGTVPDCTQSIALFLEAIFEKQALSITEINSIDAESNNTVSFNGKVFDVRQKNKPAINDEQKIAMLQAIAEVNHQITEKLNKQINHHYTIVLDWCLFECFDRSKSHPLVAIASKANEYKLCINLNGFEHNNREHLAGLQRATGYITYSTITRLMLLEHFNSAQHDYLLAVCYADMVEQYNSAHPNRRALDAFIYCDFLSAPNFDPLYYFFAEDSSKALQSVMRALRLDSKHATMLFHYAYQHSFTFHYLTNFAITRYGCSAEGKVHAAAYRARALPTLLDSPCDFSQLSAAHSQRFIRNIINYLIKKIDVYTALNPRQLTLEYGNIVLKQLLGFKAPNAENLFCHDEHNRQVANQLAGLPPGRKKRKVWSDEQIEAILAKHTRIDDNSEDSI